MRRETTLLLLALGAGLVGCSTGDAGGVTEGLTAINPADYEGVTRFYNPSLSARPLSVDEIGDTSDAYPVTMTFGQRYTVAWAVIDGVPQIENGAAVLGVWRIYHSRDAVPVDGEVRPGETPVVTVPDNGGVSTHPGDTTSAGGNPLLGTPDVSVSRPFQGATGAPVYARPGMVFLDWIDEASDEYRNLFENQAIHGPCL